MKSGIHKDTLSRSLAEADSVFIYQGESLSWSVDDLIAQCQPPCIVESSLTTLITQITEQAQPGDIIVVMSNGGFEGIHEKLITNLKHHNA
jgi:UDP-N-acetylmuramate: L-alanyl-gamma-D-glutamyl-meso-diaminopimelate ligase